MSRWIAEDQKSKSKSSREKREERNWRNNASSQTMFIYTWEEREFHTAILYQNVDGRILFPCHAHGTWSHHPSIVLLFKEYGCAHWRWMALGEQSLTFTWSRSLWRSNGRTKMLDALSLCGGVICRRLFFKSVNGRILFSHITMTLQLWIHCLLPPLINYNSKSHSLKNIIHVWWFLIVYHCMNQHGGRPIQHVHVRYIEETTYQELQRSKPHPIAIVYSAFIWRITTRAPKKIGMVVMNLSHPIRIDTAVIYPP